MSAPDEVCNSVGMFLFLLKVTPRPGRAQNGKPAATRPPPPKRDMKNFKNVDSKLANLILNEIVDRYQKTQRCAALINLSVTETHCS